MIGEILESIGIFVLTFAVLIALGWWAGLVEIHCSIEKDD